MATTQIRRPNPSTPTATPFVDPSTNGTPFANGTPSANGVHHAEAAAARATPVAQTPERHVAASPFRPPWWLRNPHVQTFLGKFTRPRTSLPLERHRIETPDGDFLDLDLAPDPAPGAPLVVLLHGLEGSTRRGYMSLMFQHLLARGLRGVGMNFRSCGGEPNRVPRLYHSGETDDLAHVVDELRRRHPGRPIGAAGFSLGGNVLLKYLGERGDRAGIAAGVAVSVPFGLASCAAWLSSGLPGRTYGSHFRRTLQRKIRAMRSLLEGVVDVERGLAARTVFEYDDVLTAPLHGFDGADDYYARADARPHLGRIRVPVLVVHSLDDPFTRPDAFPDAAVSANPHIATAYTDRGGHLGFVEGALPWRPRFWAEREAASFLARRLPAGFNGGLNGGSTG